MPKPFNMSHVRPGDVVHLNLVIQDTQPEDGPQVAEPANG